MYIIPSGKRYIKWIKKRKADKKINSIIEKLKKFYPDLSTRECKMIISFLMSRKRGKNEN